MFCQFCSRLSYVASRLTSFAPKAAAKLQRALQLHLRLRGLLLYAGISRVVWGTTKDYDCRQGMTIEKRPDNESWDFMES